MSVVIPPGYYFLNPDINSILLFPPYDVISIEQVLSIRNLSKKIDIYNSEDPRRHKSFLAGASQIGADIEIENGIMSYAETAGMDSSDKIQITLSDNITNTDTGITSSTIDGGSSASSAMFSIDGGSSISQSNFEMDGGQI